ncbi:hypothetical protein F5883DRAFT_439541 [Diaporthe sp. PMI_573]|nr:hypothetical protein F5883DRAFT_439541 [Diaporthaceae sp. PMI_573]
MGSGEFPPSEALDDIGSRVIIATVVCLFIAMASAALRSYVRVAIVKKVSYDDWATATSWVLLLRSGITAALATRYGLGRHIHALNAEDIKTLIFKIMIFEMVTHHLAIATVKAAFLLQYRRCFPLPTLQRVCDILLSFVSLWGLASALVVIFLCIPVSLDWARLPPLQCADKLVFWFINATIHVVTDIIIYCLPIPLLRMLPIQNFQKIALVSVFSMGFFVCAISVIRIFTLRKSITNSDHTWNTAMPAIWSLVELSCAIICLCVPTLRPLIRSRTIPPQRQTALMKTTEDRTVVGSIPIPWNKDKSWYRK